MSRFTFPTLTELQENYHALVNNVIAKHQVESPDKLPTSRKAQLEKIERALHQAESLTVKLFDNDQERLEQFQSATVLGVYLDIKQGIKNSYENSYSGALLNYIPYSGGQYTNPQNDALYSEIDTAIGVTDENVLDDEAIKNIRLVHQANQTKHAINAFDSSKLKPTTTKDSGWVKDQRDTTLNEFMAFDQSQLKTPAVEDNAWKKTAEAKNLSQIKLFDHSNLNKTETRESGLVFTGDLPQMPKY